MCKEMIYDLQIQLYHVDVSDGLCRPQLRVHLDVCFHHVGRLRHHGGQDTREDPAAEVGQRGVRGHADL